MKRLGCMLTYLLYTVIYYVYFAVIGKLVSSLPLGIGSDALLAISLFYSSVSAVMTAIIIVNWKKISTFVDSKRKTSQYK